MRTETAFLVHAGAVGWYWRPPSGGVPLAVPRGTDRNQLVRKSEYVPAAIWSRGSGDHGRVAALIFSTFFSSPSVTTVLPLIPALTPFPVPGVGVFESPGIHPGPLAGTEKRGISGARSIDPSGSGSPIPGPHAGLPAGHGAVRARPGSGCRSQRG